MLFYATAIPRLHERSGLIVKTRNMALFGAIVITVLVISQLIGIWVNNAIPLNTTIELNTLIHFTHIRNYGGVFGLLQGMGWIFGLIGFSLLIAVVAYLRFGKDVSHYEYICFGFIVGGGSSNILDRLVYGNVIDFIDIQHIPYWNYIFNTADLMIHVGIWPMLILSFLTSSSTTDPENASE